MPKLKTHSSKKKRFKITGTGKVKMNHAERRHRLISKTKSSKKANRKGAYAVKTDAANIKKMLPYG